MLEIIQEVVSRFQEQFPAAVTTLQPLGPNALTLAVVLGDQLVELDWSASEGFGVTLVTEDKSFTRGSDAAFTNAVDAEKYLAQQLTMIAGLHQED